MSLDIVSSTYIRYSKILAISFQFASDRTTTLSESFKMMCCLDSKEQYSPMTCTAIVPYRRNMRSGSKSDQHRSNITLQIDKLTLFRRVFPMTSCLDFYFNANVIVGLSVAYQLRLRRRSFLNFYSNDTSTEKTFAVL